MGPQTLRGIFSGLEVQAGSKLAKEEVSFSNNAYKYLCSVVKSLDIY